MKNLFDLCLLSAHRKGDKPQSQLRSKNLDDETNDMDLPMLTQPKGRKRLDPKPLSESDDDDDDAVPPIRTSRDKAPSRLGSAPPQKRTTGKKKPLFLDSDENDDGDNAMDVGDEEQTLPSSFESRQTVGRRTTREKTKSRKPAPIIVDDDSDDDAVFKGFKGQKRGR